MTRILSLFCLAVSCAAAAQSGLRLVDHLAIDLSEPVAPGGKAVIATAQPPIVRQSALPVFRQIFGQTPPAAAPIAEPRPAAPAISHRLIGTVVHDRLRYAILSGPDGELVLREGETLASGGKIARILGDRIDVVFPGSELALRLDTGSAGTALTLTPAAETPQATRPGVKPYRGMVTSASLSREEVMILVAAAEARLINSKDR